MYKVQLGGALFTVLILAMITGFRPLYWLVYVVLVGAGLGYLWAWLQSRGLNADVQQLSSHPQVGQTAHLEVEVREKAGLPRGGLRARLTGDFLTRDEQDFSLSSRGTATWTVSGLCRHRGLNTVGSLTMVSSDPTGLFSLECRVGQPRSVLVYPATVELSRTPVAGQAIGGVLGETGPLVGHSAAASLVRQAEPGEGLSRIHWPTTARLDQLMAKEFEGTGINEVWLFVDLQRDVQAGIGDDNTEGCCITIAASLAKSLIQDSHAVGLVTQGNQFYRFPPRKDYNHLWAMLRALALVRATGRTPLHDLLAAEGDNLGPGSVAMVVAPWPGKGLENLFQFLTRRGVLVVPIFLDTPSFGRPFRSRQPGEVRIGMHEWTFVIRRGDDLSASLGNVLDQIAIY